MAAASRQGKTERNQTAKRIGHGKAIRPMSRRTRDTMVRAASFASMNIGIGQVLRSVRRERTKPGHTTFTRIFSGRRKPRSESPQLFTQAFVAAYEGHGGRGAYPAIEAVMTICACLPGPWALNSSIAGRTVFTTPPTLRLNVARTFSDDSLAVPRPALAKTTARGHSASHSRIQRPTASTSVTSTLSAFTSSAPTERQDSATEARRPSSRPQRKSVLAPRLAHSIATASPIPLEAPVINTPPSRTALSKESVVLLMPP